MSTIVTTDGQQVGDVQKVAMDGGEIKEVEMKFDKGLKDSFAASDPVTLGPPE